MNHKIQVSKINKQPGKLPHNKNRVLPVDRISQEGNAAANTEIPESDGEYTFFLTLAFQPLHDKSSRK